MTRGRPMELGIPTRDPSFRALIASLSEPPTGPHADNLMTNEDSFPRVASELAARVPNEGVYLGVGPDQNFTYIAHCQPDFGFLLDYRRRNLRLHLLHKALFMLAPDRITYLERLTARTPRELPPNPAPGELVGAFRAARFQSGLLSRTRNEVKALLQPMGVLEADEWADLSMIQARLAGPGMGAQFLALPMYPDFGSMIETTDRHGKPAHFLASESYYQRVRELHLHDRIIPIVADLAGAIALQRLADWLKDQSLLVTAFYVSDVEFFLLRAGRFPDYLKNLRRLPWHDNGVIIRSSTREIDHPARVPGDSSTTIVVAAHRFLERATHGPIQSPDELFDDPGH